MSLSIIELGNDSLKQTAFYIQLDISFCHLRITQKNDIYSASSSDEDMMDSDSKLRSTKSVLVTRCTLQGNYSV